MTKAQMIERYGIEKYNEHKERINANNKNNPKYIEYLKEYHKKPEVMKREKEYKSNEINSDGKTKNYIRNRSRIILFDKRHHTKFKDYEIHHCFGYDDPSKFIYIPRSLHRAIHSFLKENNINADTDHYKYISTMINECTEYTYISA